MDWPNPGRTAVIEASCRSRRPRATLVPAFGRCLASRSARTGGSVRQGRDATDVNWDSVAEAPVGKDARASPGRRRNAEAASVGAQLGRPRAMWARPSGVPRAPLLRRAGAALRPMALTRAAPGPLVGCHSVATSGTVLAPLGPPLLEAPTSPTATRKLALCRAHAAPQTPPEARATPRADPPSRRDARVRERPPSCARARCSWRRCTNHIRKGEGTLAGGWLAAW